jgi:Mor family transcriptional regulator
MDAIVYEAPELLVDLHDIATGILQEQCAIGGAEAGSIAWRLVDEFRRMMGGQQFYVAKGAKMDLAARDRALWADFDGRNHAALARKYRLSIKSVYRRLRYIHQAIQNGQGDIFLED